MFEQLSVLIGTCPLQIPILAKEDRYKYAARKTNSGLCMFKHLLYAGREMQCEEESRGVTVRSREEGGWIQTGLQHFAKLAKNTPHS